MLVLTCALDLLAAVCLIWSLMPDPTRKYHHADIRSEFFWALLAISWTVRWFAR